MKTLCFLALALFCSAPALASVSVSSPLNGASVPSPFKLVASATACSSQSIVAIGYSLDNSSTTTTVKSSSLSTSVAASVGAHVVHVKSWGTNGAACSSSVSITVVNTATTSTTTNVTVASPASGASVVSPFTLAAGGTLCNGQTIVSTGYSLDSSSTTTVFKSQSFSSAVSATQGSHTVHVKAWGNAGSSCAASVAVSVKAPAPVVTAPSIPSTALATKDIQKLTTWGAAYDVGTSGTATGSTQIVSTPAVSGAARQFASSYTNYGGERYNVSVGDDAAATNFVYDTLVYVATPSSDVANIEMDLNQVISNGETVIYGFQCDGWSHTWDYAENAGTPTSPKAHWLHSNQTCYPQKWATGTWHHVQIQYSRDDSGNVTYKAVWLDGAEQDLNITVPSAFALGWGKTLLINFQIDGATSTSGSSTIYLDNTTIYSW